ncbi:MAG: tyrosine-type recombinase/integrase [Nitrospiraceae bacterium]|nr:tyrosine-type recombinase/integrase [Nitrospiraceae bacterium]
MAQAKPDLDMIAAQGRYILEVYASHDKQVTKDICDRIMEVLTETIDRTQRTKLTNEDVKAISKALEVNNNSRSYQTWLHWDTFNHFVTDLKKESLVWSPLIDIPKRARPFLVLEAEDHIIRNVRSIQVIHDYLLRFPTGNESYSKGAPGRRGRSKKLRKQREIEYLCSFVAASAIFGKILFDDYHRWLLTLSRNDINLKPCYINRTSPNSDTIRRFFLPLPASAYFMRCCLFYQEHAKRLVRVSPGLKDKIFALDAETLAKFPGNFSKWTSRICREAGIDHSDGLRIWDFRKAVIAASSINLEKQHGKYNNVPPFIIAIQSSKMPSYSYGNRHFSYFFGETPSATDYLDLSANGAVIASTSRYKIENAVADIVKKITTARRKLLKAGMSGIDKRRETIADIWSIVANSDIDPESSDYRNITHYMHWLEYMIINSDLKTTSINTYASQIPKLFVTIIRHEALDMLSRSDLELALSQTMYEYQSKNIREALKDFSEYLAVQGVGAFKDLDWKSKRLSKNNVPSIKSFVQIEEFEAALEMSYLFFIPMRKRLVGEKSLTDKEKLRIAHKASLIRIVCYLGYYGGLRISEIMKLRCRHIKYNGGYYITIMKTKTKNGERNVPIQLLFPESVLSEFIKYYRARRESGGHDALLCVNHKGQAWSKGHVSREAARLFTYMNVRNFRFHFLRHCFVNLFAMRWLAAFHWDKVPSNAPIFKHEIFNEKHLDNIRHLILGMGIQRIGNNLTANVLQTISRLVGHGGPLVTVKEYFHCSDILFHIWSKHLEEVDVKINIRQAMDFLQQKHSQLPSIFHKPTAKSIPSKVSHKKILKKITALQILDYQRSALLSINGMR